MRPIWAEISPMGEGRPGEWVWDLPSGVGFCQRDSFLSPSLCVWVCCGFSLVQLFETPWPLARQAPLSMGFSRQEYCSGLPRPLPGDLPSPGIEATSPVSAGGFFTTRATWEAPLPASRVLNWVREWTGGWGWGWRDIGQEATTILRGC